MRTVRVALIGPLLLSVFALSVDQPERPAAAAEGGFAGLPAEALTASGGWSWFEGPRAILTDCELLVGSVATGSGDDGAGRAGDIDVVTRSLVDGSSWVDTLAEGLEQDDHDSPALLELPGGRVVAGWTRHNRDRLLRGATRIPGFPWWSATPSGEHAGGTVTYRNLVHLADEGGPSGTTYDLFRGRSPNGRLSPTIRRSDDLGTTWEAVGPLLLGANTRPYLRYADDGASRIDLGVTEGHPKEVAAGTGIYHGYLEDGVLHGTAGDVLAEASNGTNVDPTGLTPVFEGDALHRAWILDVAQAPGGPVLVWSVRDLSAGVAAEQRNTYWYGRWDGTTWQTHQLAVGGTSLWHLEEYYTGGVAIDPADPSRLVLSTDVDPTTGLALPHHELFDAVSPDGGSSWSFTAITPGSTVENIRPLLPEPSVTARALVWMAGRYDGFEDYDTSVQAIVDGGPDGPCPEPTYVRGPHPFTGDFDGDGRTDRLHYRPGSTPDTVFWGDGDRTVVRVDGTYTPMPVRFADRPQAEAIVWSNPAGASYRWDASGHAFTSRRYFGVAGSRPVVGDFDGDGVDDLLHYRPGGQTDLLDVSAGSGYQRRTVRVDGTYQPLVGDFDGNGRDDIFLTHLVDQTNTIYRALDGAGYEDRSGSSGLGAPSLERTGWGCALADLDLDGDLDVAVANGRILRGAVEQGSSDGPFWNPYAERIQIFRGDGRGRFVEEVPAAGDAWGRPLVGRALVAADLDGDGTLDLVLATTTGRVRVLRNRLAASGSAWVAFRAIDSGRDAFGASIALEVDGSIRTRPVISSAGFQSAVEPIVHFGLGRASAPANATVTWNDGIRERFAVARFGLVQTLERGRGARD